MKHFRNAIIALCLLPLAAQAGTQSSSSISAEIQQDLTDAREEVRIELAQARQELVTGNLRIDNSLQFGGHGSGKSGRNASDLPLAEITPQGDLLIDGKAQKIDANQRRELLAYRGQVVKVAMQGIEIGQRSADAALDAVGGSWLGILFSAMTGQLENRVERVVKQQIEPAVRGICRQLPAVMESQQRLASSLPQFRPYATLQADDIEDCESEIRQEFASR